MAVRRMSNPKARNPRRKRRRRRNTTIAANPKRRRRRRRNVRNGTRAGQRRKTARRAYRRNRGRVRRRNSSNGSTAVKKMPFLNIALGAGAAIALKQIVSNLKPVRDQIAKDPTSMVALAIAPALTFGVGWAVNTYMKGKMAKEVGKYIALAALVVGVDDVAGAQIRKSVANIGQGGGAGAPPPGVVKGSWGPTYTNGALAGAWTGPGLEGGSVEHPSALFGLSGIGGFQ